MNTTTTTGAEAAGTSLSEILITGFVVLGSCAAWIFTENLALAVAPILAVAVCWGVLRLQLHHLAAIMFFVGVGMDDPGVNPHEDLFRGPLFIPAALIYVNLKQITNVGALKFSMMDVLLATILLLVFLKKGSTDHQRPGYTPTPAPLKYWAFVPTFAIIGLIVWGKAHGGDMKSALWQYHILFWVGPLTYFFQRALRGEKDVMMLTYILYGSVVYKTIEGAFFDFFITKTKKIEFITTHSDTELFVPALVGLLLMLVHKRSKRTLLAFFTLVPTLLFIIIRNNRRIAWVCLMASLVAIYATYPTSRIKLKITKVLLSIAPVLAIYVGIGTKVESGPFAPAAKIVSLFSSKDKSNEYRVIENFDVISSIHNPILGRGFGIPFEEPIKLDDISGSFELMHFLPHNSVLWMHQVGGWIGFTALWMHIPVTIFFCAKVANHVGVKAIHRIVALTTMSVAISRMMLMFGDMGAIRWLGWFFYAVGVAMTGKAAVACGAWPLSTRRTAAQRSGIFPQPRTEG